MRNNPKPIIEKETFEVPCRTYGCYNRAKYRLGNPKGSPIAFHHICESCAKSIFESLPGELNPISSNSLYQNLLEEHDKMLELLQEKNKEIENLLEEKENKCMSQIPQEVLERIETLNEHQAETEDNNKHEVTLEKINNMSYKELQQYSKDLGINATGKYDELFERVTNEWVNLHG